MPWVALGLVLVLGGAMVFTFLGRPSSSLAAVIVAAEDLTPGMVVGPDDVRVAHVDLDGQVDTILASRRDEVVGRRIQGLVPAGALLHPHHVDDGQPLRSNEAVVGAALAAGALPGESLAVGDRVLLVAAGGTVSDGGDPELLGEAVVWSVGEPGQQGSRVVALLVSRPQVEPVAAAAASGALRLALVVGDT
jgi:hypothetical protein